MALGLSACLIMHATQCWGQNVSRMDSIPSDSLFQVYEFHLDIPIGQTFVNHNKCQSYHKVRFHTPNNGTRTHINLDTNGRTLSTQVAMMSPNTSTYNIASIDDATGTQVKMRGSLSVNDDPSKYLSELRPAIHQPIYLDMQLGMGSAYLDLTDIRTRGINIESSATDIFLSYKKPNPERMKNLRVTAGMSRIFIRNLEMARANNITIDNGVGDTKIIIGDELFQSSHIEIAVGGGACIMMIHDDIPMKIVLKNGLFSTVEIPDNYYKSGEDTYVNLAYKTNSSKYITAIVDLGIGTFTLVTYQ